MRLAVVPAGLRVDILVHAAAAGRLYVSDIARRPPRAARSCPDTATSRGPRARHRATIWNSLRAVPTTACLLRATARAYALDTNAVARFSSTTMRAGAAASGDGLTLAERKRTGPRDPAVTLRRPLASVLRRRAAGAAPFVKEEPDAPSHSVPARAGAVAVVESPRPAERDACRAPSSTSQRGVMPGATVTATEVATGRQSVAVTSEDGRYRLENLPPGDTGSASSCRASRPQRSADIELLVGSNATVPPMAMKLAGVEETVTVSAPDAARRRAVVAGGRKHRSPPDGGAAAAGPQLAGAVADGQGHHGQQRRQHAGRRRRSVPAQSRRPADHAARRRLGLRSAEGQPRGDRRVPDRDQHVRHHPGALHRHAGAGDLALGHQRPQGGRLRLLPQRQVQRARPGRRTRCCRSRTSRSAARWAGRSCATRAHFFGSYEYERQPRHGVPGADAAAEPDVRVPDQGRQQELSGPRGLSAVSSANTFTRARPALGVRATRSRSRAARRTRPPPSSCGSTRPTSSAPGRTSSATT